MIEKVIFLSTFFHLILLALVTCMGMCCHKVWEQVMVFLWTPRNMEGRGGKAPLILKLSSGWKRVDNLTPLFPLRRGKPLIILRIGSWLGPKPVWKLCGKEKSVAAARNRATIPPRFAPWPSHCNDYDSPLYTAVTHNRFVKPDIACYVFRSWPSITSRHWRTQFKAKSTCVESVLQFLRPHKFFDSHNIGFCIFLTIF